MSNIVKVPCRLAQISKLHHQQQLANGRRDLVSLACKEREFVILKSPTELREKFGLEKYVAEVDGSSAVTAVAATKKLLAEERLRRESYLHQVPISQIVTETYSSRSKHAALASITGRRAYEDL